MTTLAVDTPRDYGQGDIEQYPVIASDIIYEGAAVGENGSGYSRPLVAGDPFQGFCLRKADNSAGAAGAINVLVRSTGYIVLAISAIAITANDLPAVYASDDGTFTLTAGSNTQVGHVARWISTGFALVFFHTPRLPTGTVDTGDIAADAVEGTKIADDAVSLEHLDAALTPSHTPKYMGEVTWSGGGATLAETVTGVAATDIVIASILTLGSEGTILQGAIASTNTITFTLDAANTSNDAVISYAVFRAAA
jgi:hypothetical protein